MKLYQISELEQLSGIKAATIRMWERRFQLIQPWRTDTNIRLYDDSQVRKILNISTLLHSGCRISQVAAYSKDELHHNVLLVQQSGAGEEQDLFYVNALISAVVSFDEADFNKTFDVALASYGMNELVLRIFYPFLRKLGIMWVTESVAPVQEHFASALVRRKLLAAVDGLQVRADSTKSFLLMLPPGEWHEIGLLYAEYLIRAKGINTVYLGANVPFEHVAGVVAKKAISHVLLLYTTPAEPENMFGVRKQMHLPAAIPILVAGNKALTASLKGERNITVLDAPMDLLAFLK